MNVIIHKNQNLGEEMMWSGWYTMVSMVNIGSNGLKRVLTIFKLNQFYFNVYINKTEKQQNMQFM